MLSRATVTAADFLKYPARRDELPPLAMIEAAVEAGIAKP
jgi:hypothetical protein